MSNLIEELKKRKLLPFIVEYPAPFAVICPGGAYYYDSASIEGIPYAIELNKAGFSAFVLQYGIKDEGRFPAPMNDLGCAVEFILNNSDKLGVKSEAYSVWGSSAGGHLAASFGTKRLGYEKYKVQAPAAIILAYPVITMMEYGHPLTRKTLLGENPSDEMLLQTSLEFQITHDFPPTFLWNSKTDKTVSYQNGILLKSALDQADVINEYICYETGQHAIGLGKNSAVAEWFDSAVSFWNRVRNHN